MGYRSDVRIATTREGYERLCKHVDELSAGKNTCPLLGANRMPEFFEENDGSVAFGWDWVKWYDGTLVDVSNVTTALSSLIQDGVPCEFCRTGEKYDDIEFACYNENESLALHVEPSVSIETVSD